MTSQIKLNDTSTLHISVNTIKDLEPILVDTDVASEAERFDSILGRVITVNMRAADSIRIPYNADQEGKRMRNRIANLGLPQSSTTTQF